MFCVKCGKAIKPPDASFCPNCGQKVEASTQKDTEWIAEPDDRPALVRPREGRLLGGVAAGMARHFGISVTAMRVLWIVVSIATIGLVALFYPVLWKVIPPEK